MARTRVWRRGVLEGEDFPTAQISEYLEHDDTLVWADLCVPDRDDLQAVADELGLDELAVEDALDRHERPKADRYPSHLFVTTYALGLQPAGELQLTKVSAFQLPQAVVTVHREDFDVEPVVKSWDDNADLLQFGAPALLYGLLDHLVDGHLEVLQQLDDQIEEAEDRLFDDPPRSGTDIQRSTYRLRRHLTGIRKVVLPMRDMVENFQRHRDPAHPTELTERYRDLHDHVLRANEWTDSLRDVVTTMFETGLSLADARLNQIVRKLSAWAAIIAVPTAVTGFYGQNVPYPGFGQHHGFVTSCVVTAVLAVGAWVGFKRNGWL